MAPLNPPTCLLCDRAGRKNQIKISCNHCHTIYHSTCLRLTPKETKRFRAGGFSCWGCSLPPFSDSLLSIPEPLPAPLDVSILQLNGPNKDFPTLLAFNARSLKDRKKRADIHALLHTHSPDIIAINETWLSPEISDSEVIPSNYVTFRKDRIEGRRPAGGVLLAVRPHLQPKRIEHLETAAEIVWVEIKAGDLHILVASVYRRPRNDADANTQLVRSLDLAAGQRHNYDGCFIAGDFNLDVNWAAAPPRAGVAPASVFLESFADMGLTQMINGPTRTTATTETTIDLLLTDSPELVQSAAVVLGVSDHDALFATLAVRAPRPTAPPVTVFDFRHAEWETLEAKLAERLENFQVENSADESWEKWKKIIFEVVTENVPKKTFKPNAQKAPPWLSKHIRKLISSRDKLFKKWVNVKTRPARESYIAARKAAQKEVRRAKDEYMWRLGGGSEGAKNLWRFVNAHSKVPVSNSTFTTDGKYLTEPKEVAEHFNQIFQQNFSSDPNVFPFLRRQHLSQDKILSDLKISPEEVVKYLKATKTNAAPGEEKIPAVLLKNCANVLSESLSRVFNLSLESGDLPLSWKSALVTPIFKDGEKKDMRNYRPISVTSLVGKVLEKFVRDKINQFLAAEKIIPESQHGFTAGRSCTTLLTRLIDDWTAALDKRSGTHIHVIFLDWAKAFDKVPHQRLLSKLEYYGFRGPLLRWLTSFLTGRTQRVLFGGALSAPCEVASGVIQGSVLGPLLFNIFMADLAKNLKTNIAQYADDCSLWNEILSLADADELQNDLDTLDRWCANNGMRLNARKCKVMDITHARTPLYLEPAREIRPREYFVGGATLQYTDCERLLGLYITKDLSWNTHSSTVRAKAAKTLGFVSRTLQNCTPRVKRIAYLSLVKPILFYGTPAWSPINTDANMNKLIKMQKRGLHFIHGKHLPPVRDQNMLTIEMQLRYNDLLFFKKSETGVIDFDARARISIASRVLRGDNPLRPRLQPPPFRTHDGQCAFPVRVVKPWNDLPPALQDCTAAQFPSLYRAHLWQSFPL